MTAPGGVQLFFTWVLAWAVWLEGPLSLSAYTVWGLSLALIVWCGASFHQGVLRSLKDRGANADMLICLSLWAAFLLSTAVVFFPESLSSVVGAHWMKSIAAITSLSLTGRWLEFSLTERSGEAVGKLMRRMPRSARRVKNAEVTSVLASSLKAGDEIIVRSGEVVPVDGEIVEGTSSVDESVWSGGAAPVEKTVGAKVVAGTQNKDGELRVRVLAAGDDTALARVVAAVCAGFEAKAARAGVADGLARAYVPALLLTAVGAALIWSWKGPDPRIAHSLSAFALVLASACPWAIDLAAPAALAAGLRRASERGIRFRNPGVVELFERPDVVILDKKGILTEGHPDVLEILPLNEWNKNSLLLIAAAAERRSAHPFSEALRRATAGLELPKVESFEAYPGRGVSAVVAGRRVLAGSPAWLRENSIEEFSSRPAAGQESMMGVAVDGKPAGFIVFRDLLRPGSVAAVQELRAMGVEVVLASGDLNASAHAIAELAGIGKVFSEVVEEDKVRIIGEMQARGRKVVLMGEGVRDAAALSRADLGVSVAPPPEAGAQSRSAMGAGLDLAAEAADILLAGRDLGDLTRALRMSLGIRSVVRSNLRWAFAAHWLLIPIAAGALHPAFGIGLTPIWLGTAAAVGLTGVIVGSIRFLIRREP